MGARDATHPKGGELTCMNRSGTKLYTPYRLDRCVVNRLHTYPEDNRSLLGMDSHFCTDTVSGLASTVGTKGKALQLRPARTKKARGNGTASEPTADSLCNCPSCTNCCSPDFRLGPLRLQRLRIQWQRGRKCFHTLNTCLCHELSPPPLRHQQDSPLHLRRMHQVFQSACKTRTTSPFAHQYSTVCMPRSRVQQRFSPRISFDASH